MINNNKKVKIYKNEDNRRGKGSRWKMLRNLDVETEKGADEQGVCETWTVRPPASFPLSGLRILAATIIPNLGRRWDFSFLGKLTAQEKRPNKIGNEGPPVQGPSPRSSTCRECSKRKLCPRYGFQSALSCPILTHEQEVKNNLTGSL